MLSTAKARLTAKTASPSAFSAASQPDLLPMPAISHAGIPQDAVVRPEYLAGGDVLHLQQTLGNAATGRLLLGAATPQAAQAAGRVQRLPQARQVEYLADVENVRDALATAAPLLEEARHFFLPFPQPVERQYLVNRLEKLDATFRALQAEFNQREKDGTLGRQALARLKGRLCGADFLPLLKETMPVARQFEPRLADKLKHVFETPLARRGVRYEAIAPLIARAGNEQKKEAVRDKALMDDAARRLAPEPYLVPEDQPLFNDAPEFVRGLDVQQSGTVKPHDAAAVDVAIRSELRGWVRAPVARGATVERNVRVLSGPLFSAVEKIYTGGAGGGGANAFTEDGTIYLHSSKGDPSTIVHEGIHQYAHGVFRDVLGGAIDEGTTETFARRVATAIGYPNRRNYPDEFAAAGRLFGSFGIDRVAAAYFSGNIKPLRQAFITRVRKKHPLFGDENSDWETFCDYLRNRLWDDAFRIIE